MEWIERLNDAVRYMEEHLTDEISYEQLGRIACCSSYHFQRMFAYMAGVPLSEYIRRRKMSLAAVDLKSGDAKVIDIAAKYGYRSPTAFNRAFQITVSGAAELSYRVEQKEAFRIVGLSRPLEPEIEKNFAVVPGLWQEAAMNGTVEKLAGMMDTAPMGILGVSVCNDEEQWKYFLAAASTKKDDSLEEYMVPSFTWAIFSGEGACPGAIQELERRIVTEWLPTSGYEYDNGPDIEVYLNPDPSDAKFEVWIPIRQKQAHKLL